MDKTCLWKSCTHNHKKKLFGGGLQNHCCKPHFNFSHLIYCLLVRSLFADAPPINYFLQALDHILRYQSNDAWKLAGFCICRQIVKQEAPSKRQKLIKLVLFRNDQKYVLTLKTNIMLIVWERIWSWIDRYVLTVLKYCI